MVNRLFIGIIVASTLIILIGLILLLGWAIGGWFKKSTPDKSLDKSLGPIPSQSPDTNRLQIGVCMAPGVYHGEKIPLDEIIDGIDIWWDWNPGFTTNSDPGKSFEDIYTSEDKEKCLKKYLPMDWGGNANKVIDYLAQQGEDNVIAVLSLNEPDMIGGFIRKGYCPSYDQGNFYYWPAGGWNSCDPSGVGIIPELCIAEGAEPGACSGDIAFPYGCEEKDGITAIPDEESQTWKNFKNLAKGLHDNFYSKIYKPLKATPVMSQRASIANGCAGWQSSDSLGEQWSAACDESPGDGNLTAKPMACVNCPGSEGDDTCTNSGGTAGCKGTLDCLSSSCDADTVCPWFAEVGTEGNITGPTNPAEEKPPADKNYITCNTDAGGGELNTWTNGGNGYPIVYFGTDEEKSCKSACTMGGASPDNPLHNYCGCNGWMELYKSAGSDHWDDLDIINVHAYGNDAYIIKARMLEYFSVFKEDFKGWGGKKVLWLTEVACIYDKGVSGDEKYTVPAEFLYELLWADSNKPKCDLLTDDMPDKLPGFGTDDKFTWEGATKSWFDFGFTGFTWFSSTEFPGFDCPCGASPASDSIESGLWDKDGKLSPIWDALGGKRP